MKLLIVTRPILRRTSLNTIYCFNTVYCHDLYYSFLKFPYFLCQLCLVNLNIDVKENLTQRKLVNMIHASY